MFNLHGPAFSLTMPPLLFKNYEQLLLGKFGCCFHFLKLVLLVGYSLVGRLCSSLDLWPVAVVAGSANGSVARGPPRKVGWGSGGAGAAGAGAAGAAGAGVVVVMVVVVV